MQGILLCITLNKTILLKDLVEKRGQSFTAKTIGLLLRKCGFYYDIFKRGLYADGHERPEVITRQRCSIV